LASKGTRGSGIHTFNKAPALIVAKARTVVGAIVFLSCTFTILLKILKEKAILVTDRLCP
jgi:hypothetical protein